MPALSAKQQHLFGLALAAKRGKAKGKSPAAKRIAQSLTASKIKEFAATKGLKQ